MKTELLKELHERRDQIERLVEQDYLSPEDVKTILETMLALNKAVIDMATNRSGSKKVQRNIGEKMAMQSDSQPEMYLSERWDDF